MIVVRDIFQAKFGRGGELENLFKQSADMWSQKHAYRILTDASGPFFTVVTEVEMASLAEWEQWLANLFVLPEFKDWFNRALPLLESGRREFYTIEAKLDNIVEG